MNSRRRIVEACATTGARHRAPTVVGRALQRIGGRKFSIASWQRGAELARLNPQRKPLATITDFLKAAAAPVILGRPTVCSIRNTGIESEKDKLLILANAEHVNVS